MKLLIRNLNRSTTEEELRALFEPHGQIELCTLRPGRQRGDEGFESHGRGGKHSSSKEAVAPSKVVPKVPSRSEEQGPSPERPFHRSPSSAPRETR